MLIKDNHIALAGGVRPALERAKRHGGHLVKIGLEVDTAGTEKWVKSGFLDEVNS